WKLNLKVGPAPLAKVLPIASRSDVASTLLRSNSAVAAPLLEPFQVALPLTFKVPMPALPGESSALFDAVALPEIVPVPPTVAPLATVTAPLPVPLPAMLVTSSVPTFTVVPPVYVSADDNVMVPAPALINPNAPLIVPPAMMLPPELK